MPLASMPNSHGSPGRCHVVTVGTRSVLVEFEVDLDVDERDPGGVVVHHLQELIEDRSAVLALAAGGGREHHGDGLPVADDLVE